MEALKSNHLNSVDVKRILGLNPASIELYHSRYYLMIEPVYDYYSVDSGIMIRLKDMLPYDLSSQHGMRLAV
jgi:hypothetical protein